MRRWSALALVVAVPALVLVAPSVSGLPRAEPVPPEVEQVLLGAVEPSVPEEPARAASPGEGPDGPAAPSAPGTLDSGERETASFQVFGVSWTGSAEGVSVRARVREDAGWSDWQEIGPTDAQPDDGSADAVRSAGRQGTEPLTTPGADAFQVQIQVTAAGAALEDVRAVLVDPGASAADDVIGRTPPGVAVAAPPAPGIISRAAWGADESLRLTACPEGPSYTSTIRVGFVHHTAGTNTYGPDQTPAILRGIYAFHVQGRGWCDVGYNFLVDAYGRVFEGRFGGTDRPVVGAHTGGFNGQSFGVALMGSFGSVAAPPAAVAALEAVLAWKLGTYGRDPNGSDLLTSAGAANSRYAAGQVARFPVVAGHRDASYTDCPGDTVVAALPGVRNDVSRLILDEPFINALFRDMLGRSPDRGGLDAWVRFLNASGSRQRVIDAFDDSEEYRRREIDRSFVLALGRGVDQAGAGPWLSLTAAGFPASRLTPLLLSSDEAYQRAGATPEGYVGMLFSTLLGRPADAGAVAAWGEVIRTSGRAAAAEGVWGSAESGFHRVASLFVQYLGRPIGPSGAGSWIALALVRGDEAARDQILNSLEYLGRASQRF